MAGNQNLVAQIIINAKDNASSAFQTINNNAGKLVAALVTYFSVVFFKGAVEDAAKFELQLDKVAAKGGYTASEMEKLTEFAQSVGTQFGKTGTESAQGLEILAAAGLNSTAAMQTLPSVLALAKSEGVSMDVAAANLTDTLSIMGLGFDQAGRAADVLTKGANLSNTSAIEMGQAFKYCGGSAKAAGYSLEETAAMIDVLAQSGIRGESAGTGLRNMLVQINDPTSKARVALEQLGIKTSNVSEIIDGLKKAGDAGKVAINEFGLVAGPTVYAMLLQGSAGIKNFTEELHKAGGASQETARVIGENFTGSQERLSAIWDALKNRLGTPILKPLSDSVDKLSNQFQTLLSTGVITSVGESLAAAFQTGGDWAVEFVKKIDFSTVGKDIESFAIKTTQTFDAIGQSAKTAGAVFSLLDGSISSVFNTINLMAAGIGTAIYATFGGITKSFGQFLVLVDSVGKYIPSFNLIGSSLKDAGVAAIKAGDDYLSFSASLKDNAIKQLDYLTESGKKTGNSLLTLSESAATTTPKIASIWAETKKVVEANKEATKTTTELATETKKTATERLQILKETHDKEVATLSQGTEERKKIDTDYLIASRKVYEDIAIDHNKSISEMSIAAQDHFNKSMAYTAAIVDAEKRKAAGIKEIEQAGMNDEQLRAEKRKEINKGISDYKKALAEGDLKKASEISKANEDLIKALAIEEATAAKNNHTSLSKTNELKNLYKQSVSDTKKAVEALQITENAQSKSLEKSIDDQNTSLGAVKETITKIDESLKGDKQLKIDTSQADKSLKDTTTATKDVVSANNDVIVSAISIQKTLADSGKNLDDISTKYVKHSDELGHITLENISLKTATENTTKSLADSGKGVDDISKKYVTHIDELGRVTLENVSLKSSTDNAKTSTEALKNSLGTITDKKTTVTADTSQPEAKISALKQPTGSTHTVDSNAEKPAADIAEIKKDTGSTHTVKDNVKETKTDIETIKTDTVSVHTVGSNAIAPKTDIAEIKLDTISLHTVGSNATAPKTDIAEIKLDTISLHTIGVNGTAPNQEIDYIKQPTSSVHTIYVQTIQQNSNGGQIQYFADGGQAKYDKSWTDSANQFVRRQGGLGGYGGGDTVPAMLEPGEWIITKEAVNYYGNSFMANVNKMTYNIPHFSTGGSVSGVIPNDASNIDGWDNLIRILNAGYTGNSEYWRWLNVEDWAKKTNQTDLVKPLQDWWKSNLLSGMFNQQFQAVADIAYQNKHKNDPALVTNTVNTKTVMSSQADQILPISTPAPVANKTVVIPVQVTPAQKVTSTAITTPATTSSNNPVSTKTVTSSQANLILPTSTPAPKTVIPAPSPALTHVPKTVTQAPVPAPASKPASSPAPVIAPAPEDTLEKLKKEADDAQTLVSNYMKWHSPPEEIAKAQEDFRIKNNTYYNAKRAADEEAQAQRTKDAQEKHAKDFDATAWKPFQEKPVPQYKEPLISSTQNENHVVTTEENLIQDAALKQAITPTPVPASAPKAQSQPIPPTPTQSNQIITIKFELPNGKTAQGNFTQNDSTNLIGILKEAASRGLPANIG